MISTNIKSPSGANLQLFVADMASAHVHREMLPITVIVPHPDDRAEWEKHMPQARVMTIVEWMKNPLNDRRLIIMAEVGFYLPAWVEHLQKLKGEVWLINWPDDSIQKAWKTRPAC